MDGTKKIVYMDCIHIPNHIALFYLFDVLLSLFFIEVMKKQEKNFFQQ